MVRPLADQEFIFADFGEAARFVNRLGAAVDRPYAEPDRSWPLGGEKIERGVKQPRTELQSLRLIQHIELIKFAMLRSRRRMRQLGGPGLGVTEQPAPDFRHPIAPARVGKLAFDLGKAVTLRLEKREIGGRIGNGEAAIDEGLAKARELEAGQFGSVLGPGGADERVQSLRYRKYQTSWPCRRAFFS